MENFLFGSYPFSRGIKNHVGSVTVPFEDGNRTMMLETGRYARLADGAVTAQVGDTVVLATVSGKRLHSKDPPNLMVNYKYKYAAAGYIPRNPRARELGSTELEILTARVIDRSLRPMFPQNNPFEVSIHCHMFALDSENDPDILAINAASTALALSSIPWNGPIGAVRVGYINEEFVTNPTRTELKNSSLDLIVSGTGDNRVVMLESSGNVVSYHTLIKAIKFGVDEIQKITQQIQDLQKVAGNKKELVWAEKSEVVEETNKVIESFIRNNIHSILLDSSHDKHSRDKATKQLRKDAKEKISSEPDHISDPTQIDVMFDKIYKQTLRELIFEKNLRCDGRGATDLRNITCEVANFKPVHGSSTFQRGQTQVMCIATLDSLDSSAKLDPMSAHIKGLKRKYFMLHYEFPPFATNEITGDNKAFASRREIGHGNLAERGLKAVFPEDYTFTVRLTSEVLESNGSSSMASVCGGSLALMDAGVPITAPVAGVAMGLVTQTDPQAPDQIQDYRVLTDIMGLEDYLGDMDFKMAGTAEGFTALQADIKLQGISMDIVKEAVLNGKDALMKILGIMKKTLPEPRTEGRNCPETEIFNIPFGKMGKFVGYGGSNLARIENETRAKITSVGDNKFIVFAPDRKAMTDAKALIDELLNDEGEPELEFNTIYTLTVMEILASGVKVQVHPKMPLIFIHNSKLTARRVHHASVLGFKVGDTFEATYFGRDPVSGVARFSRKSVLMNLTQVNKPIFRPRKPKEEESEENQA